MGKTNAEFEKQLDAQISSTSPLTDTITKLM
jgi:hypothetical protein